MLPAVLLLLATALAAEEAPPKIDIAAEAAAVDVLVDRAAVARKVAPQAPLDDEHWLRRISLDVIGRIPTRDEIATFAADVAPDRRRTLVHRLLASEGHVHAEFAWWADLLRVQSRLMGRFPGDPYIDWIKRAIRDDMPFDAMVRALVTANGSLLDRGNGAVGFYVRDAGMPQDNMSNTVQVFLGTRLACAQCHNHPFDHWTRLDYMRMVAFTNGMAAQADDPLIGRIRTLAKVGCTPGDEQKSIRSFADALAIGARGAGNAKVALPKDYQYNDVKPGAVVEAHTIFGAPAVAGKGEDARLAYAAWMTSPDNPRFTLVIANRLWKKTMGWALIDPVDNLSDDSAASSPELMDRLVKLMKDLRYDLRAFEEVLYATSAYARRAAPADEAVFVPGPTVRRMTAEEMWDSLLTLVVPDLDQRRLANPEGIYAWYDALKGKPSDEVLALIEDLGQKTLERNRVNEEIKRMQLAAASPQELRKDPGFIALQARQKELNDKLQAASVDNAAKPVAEQDPRWKDFRRDLVRASELPTPAPPGHLLRDFGQSDRQLIDNANPDASVPQALSLLNGFIDQEVLKPHSTIMKAMAEGKTPEEKAEAAFRCALTRAPTDAERARCAELLAVKGGKGPGDLVWALVNSDEFRFVP